MKMLSKWDRTNTQRSSSRGGE